MILQEGSKCALLHLMEKGINQLKIQSVNLNLDGKMPTTSLLKAYNCRLRNVYLNTRYNISYPFRYFLCFKMMVVWCIWRTLFSKEVCLSFCLKKVTFVEKNFFSLLATHIFPVSSPFLPISLTLDCKQCTEMLVFSIFQRE